MLFLVKVLSFPLVERLVVLVRKMVIFLRHSSLPLREKSPYTEIFMVRIFPHSTEYGDTEYLSVFSPNAGKY